MKTRRIMCPSVTKENKGENQRIINQSFHDVTRCVSFYVSKKKKKNDRKNNEWEKERKLQTKKVGEPKSGRESEMSAGRKERGRDSEKKKSIFLHGLEWQQRTQRRPSGWTGYPGSGLGLPEIQKKKESNKKMATMFAQNRVPGDGFGLIYILRSRWLAECGCPLPKIPPNTPTPSPAIRNEIKMIKEKREEFIKLNEFNAH